MKYPIVSRRVAVLGCAIVMALLRPRIAAAAQQYEVTDGARIAVDIAADSLTRIAMGSGRIKEFWDNDADLLIEVDDKDGSLLVMPTSVGITNRAISLFVRDAAGRAYNLVATPRDIEAASIVLRAPRTPPASGQCVRSVAEPHVRTVKRLVRAMARRRPLGAYDIEEATEEINLWSETRLLLLRRYIGAAHIGEIYRITNSSATPVVLVESEFLGLGDGIEAVALEAVEIAPEESSIVYVVRRPAAEATP